MRPDSYTNMHVTFMLSYFPNLSTKSLLHCDRRYAVALDLLLLMYSDITFVAEKLESALLSADR